MDERRYVVVVSGGECEARDDGRPCVFGVAGMFTREEARMFADRVRSSIDTPAHHDDQAAG